jgi:hypothetical protein
VGRLWVARLYVSERTRAKISSKHGLDVDDIRAHLVGALGLRGVWQHHPVRGLRALVEVYLGDQRVIVVLYPADEPDAFHVASAYRG